MVRPTGLPLWEAGLFCGLTRDVSPVRVDSWAFDSATRFPIGDCASQILELQLQSGQDCREGFSARPYARNSFRGLVRPHTRSSKSYRWVTHSKARRRYPSPTPAPVSSCGAPGAINSRGAIGFVIYSTDKARSTDKVLISAVFWLWPFGRQEFKNGYSTYRRCSRSS
jgi:hypothetical protein